MTRFHRLLLAALLATPAAPLAAAVAVPTPPPVDATAYVLVDFNSGRVLTASNPDVRHEPASLTKMMTSYVVFSELKGGHIKLDDKVRVSAKAWHMQGSRMFIEVGSEVSVENLLKGLIIQSGNDAAVALAEHVAGAESSFVDLMNQYAKRLGMTNTHFMDASGLPHPDHYSTARDLSKLAIALIRDFPQYYKWNSEKQFSWNGITQHNRNRLLWEDPSVDGLKTGHTAEAGYCLVASAKRGDMRLVSVVLGTKSGAARTRYTKALLDYGFRFYETHRLYGALEPVTTLRVWKGDVEKLGVGLEKDLYVTVPRGQYGKLDAKMALDPRIVAPVDKGDPQGKVEVTLGQDRIAERPLVALSSVGEGSLLHRLADSVRLWFE